MNNKSWTMWIGGPFPSMEVAEVCFHNLKSFHAAYKCRIDPKFLSGRDNDGREEIHIVYDVAEGQNVYGNGYSASPIDMLKYVCEFWLNGFNYANKMAEEKIAKEKANKEEAKAKKEMIKVIRFAEELKYQLALTGKVGYFDIWGKYANEDSALSGFLQGHSYGEIAAACNYLKEKGFIHASVSSDEIEVNAFNCK